MDDRTAGAPPRAPEDRRAIVVLLVDDQRFVGAALERLLAGEQDIELHCCFDAREAITLANRIRPTLILQDLVLPDIDGLTMVRMFRANPPTAATPIIVLSGNDDAATRGRALAGGANDYLVKLPSSGDLVACIRRHAGTTGDPEPGETLDRRVIAEFRQADSDGVPAFMLGLIDQFVQEAASHLDTLRHAGQRLGIVVVKATAHSLKGSSMSMGARQLAALCKQVEDEADRHPDRELRPALMAQLDREYAKVRYALEAERQGQP